jgi:mRNA interferase MazF
MNLESGVKYGELYRVHKPGGDAKSHGTFVIVSRQVLIDSKFSTVICAPVFTSADGLSTQVPIGPEEGLKHSSWIMCDNLVSLRKAELTNYIGSLSRVKIANLNNALKMALDLL